MPGAYDGGATTTHASPSALLGASPSTSTTAVTGPSATPSYQPSLFAKLLRPRPMGEADLPGPPTTMSRPSSSVRSRPSATFALPSRSPFFMKLISPLRGAAVWFFPDMDRNAASTINPALSYSAFLGEEDGPPGGKLPPAAFLLTRWTLHVIFVFSSGITSLSKASLPKSSRINLYIRNRTA